MQTVATSQTVNNIGQITLDQRYAGQKVTVHSVCDGIWHITADATPSNHEWCNYQDVRQKFDASKTLFNENLEAKKNADSNSTEMLTFDSFVGGWESFNNDKSVEEIVRNMREGRNFDY